MDKIEFTRVKHDVNGNPRYVVHFMNLLSDKEKQDTTGLDFVSRWYRIAVKRANKIGGKKYTGKDYGGGIVFQSYSLQETEAEIKSIVRKEG